MGSNACKNGNNEKRIAMATWVYSINSIGTIYTSTHIKDSRNNKLETIAPLRWFEKEIIMTNEKTLRI